MQNNINQSINQSISQLNKFPHELDSIRTRLELDLNLTYYTYIWSGLTWPKTDPSTLLHIKWFSFLFRLLPSLLILLPSYCSCFSAAAAWILGSQTLLLRRVWRTFPLIDSAFNVISWLAYKTPILYLSFFFFFFVATSHNTLLSFFIPINGSYRFRSHLFNIYHSFSSRLQHVFSSDHR